MEFMQSYHIAQQVFSNFNNQVHINGGPSLWTTIIELKNNKTLKRFPNQE